MFNIALNEKEIELLKKSINHCLETCEKGGPESGCSDCTTIKGVLSKLP